MTRVKSVLVVDDDHLYVELLRFEIEKLLSERVGSSHEIEIVSAESYYEAECRMSERAVDAVEFSLAVIDVHLPYCATEHPECHHGLRLAGLFRRQWPDVRRIIVSGVISDALDVNPGLHGVDQRDIDATREKPRLPEPLAALILDIVFSKPEEGDAI